MKRIAFRRTLNRPLNVAEGDGNMDALNVDNRPDLIASGEGTEADPFTHADSTAGLATIVAGMTRGTRVRLISSAFAASAPAPLSRHALKYAGDSAGFNEDPNGESEGVNGTKIKASNTDVFVADNNTRRGGVVVEDIYVWGGGYAQGKSAILMKSGLDQARFKNVNVSNIWAAINVLGAAGGLDTAYIHNFNVLNAGYGYINTSGGSFFNEFQGGCWADLEFSAVALLSQKNIGFSFIGMTIVRAARRNDTSGNGNSIACAMLLRGMSHKVVGNLISETGRISLQSTDANQVYNSTSPNGVHGLVVEATDCLVNGNTILGTPNNAIWVRAHRCTLVGNKFTGVAVAAANNWANVQYQANAKGFSTNGVDILIDADVQDTWIETAGPCNIVDNGVRTVINYRARNAGDPRNTDGSTGPWSYIALKPEGLSILDTVAGVLYQFSKDFKDGWRIVGDISANPGGSGGGTGGQTGLRAGGELPFSSSLITFQGGIAAEGASANAAWRFNDHLAYNATSNEKNYSFIMETATRFKLIADRNNTTSLSIIIYVTPPGGAETQYGQPGGDGRGNSNITESNVVVYDGSTLPELAKGTVVRVYVAANGGTAIINKVVAA